MAEYDAWSQKPERDPAALKAPGRPVGVGGRKREDEYRIPANSFVRFFWLLMCFIVTFMRCSYTSSSVFTSLFFLVIVVLFYGLSAAGVLLQWAIRSAVFLYVEACFEPNGET